MKPLQDVKINLNKLETVKCECGSVNFEPVYQLKKVSSMLSPSGLPGFIPVTFFKCVECGKISEYGAPGNPKNL